MMTCMIVFVNFGRIGYSLQSQDARSMTLLIYIRIGINLKELKWALIFGERLYEENV